jgi:hypothetical protein
MRTALLLAAGIAGLVAAPIAFAPGSAPSAADSRPAPDEVRFAPFGPACLKLLVENEAMWEGTWPDLPWGMMHGMSSHGDGWRFLDAELRELVAGTHPRIQVAVDDGGTYEDLLFAIYTVRAVGGRPRLAVPRASGTWNEQRQVGVEEACAPSSSPPPSPPPS